MAIPHDYITELIQRNEMVDVAQSYVQLRRSGRTYSGLCPFHSCLLYTSRCV